MSNAHFLKERGTVKGRRRNVSNNKGEGKSEVKKGDKIFQCPTLVPLPFWEKITLERFFVGCDWPIKTSAVPLVCPSVCPFSCYYSSFLQFVVFSHYSFVYLFLLLKLFRNLLHLEPQPWSQGLERTYVLNDWITLYTFCPLPTPVECWQNTFICSSNTSMHFTIFKHWRRKWGCWHLFCRYYGYDFILLAFSNTICPSLQIQM